MSPQRLRQLLQALQSGDVTVADAITALGSLPFRELGFATVDHHRALRQGVPEVIFGESKPVEQIAAIAGEILSAGHNLLVTRLDPDKASALGERLAPAEMRYSALARVARLEPNPVPAREAEVAVICAGTSDLPVAEEAIETLSAVGLGARRVIDVGVAGIHRLFDRIDDIEGCRAAIVIAGMEGALPSVVGGLVPYPVIAVPTSVGYGTALGGFTALMSMLTSCASGLVVVNIDNGFGAAMAAHRILPRAPEPT